MQKIGWIVAILCGLSWFASEIPLPSDESNAPAEAEISWRRTTKGWEKTSEWSVAVEKTPPVVHPGVVGLLMLACTLSVGIAKKEPAK